MTIVSDMSELLASSDHSLDSDSENHIDEIKDFIRENIDHPEPDRRNKALEMVHFVESDEQLVPLFEQLLRSKAEDSEGEEGKFYLWNEKEIDQILAKDDANFIKKIFNTVADGNYKEEATAKVTGHNILYLKKNENELAKEMAQQPEDLEARLTKCRKLLFDKRKMRIHPLKDDKILTDWNGLMIAAISLAGRVFKNQAYLNAAAKAARFVGKNLKTKEGLLLKRYRQGEAKLPAHIEDYAFYQWGLLELYEATFDIDYLKEAIDLHEVMSKHFWDTKNGGFFFTDDINQDLISRTKELYDGAIPSGNSVAAMNLLRLGHITGNVRFLEMAEEMEQGFSSQLMQGPVSYTQYLLAFDFATGPTYEIVISSKSNEKAEAMLTAINKSFIPNKVILVRSQKNSAALAKIAEYTKDQTSQNNKATAYVCTNFSCKLPTTDIKKMMELIEN